MKLQYQTSFGTWFDCDGREDEFIDLAEKSNKVSPAGEIVQPWEDGRMITREEVISALQMGNVLRIDPSCGGDNCRMAVVPNPAPEFVSNDFYQGIESRMFPGGQD